MEKRTITDADIAFLEALQNERLTQANDYCAEPVIWFVAQEKEVPAPDGCGDKQYITDGEDNIMDLNDAKEYAKNNELASDDAIDSITCLDDMVVLLNDTEESSDWRIADIIVEQNCIDYNPGCFLTKRACKEHIDANSHHYVNGNTYGSSVWRNPEFEKLIEIIEHVDFNALKK